MPFINVKDVVVKNRIRKVNQSVVDAMVDSIKEVGLMTPIVVHGNRLICGHHRLEAYKRLGYGSIACVNISDTTKEDQNILLEIDENLIRSELTPRQREQHIEIKAKILAKRYKKKYLDEAIESTAKRKSQDEDKLREKVLGADNFRRDLGEVDLNVAENVKSVIRAAESNAMAQAAKEIANSLGHKSVAQVNKDIANSEALTNANLDENKLDQLNATQLKEVARVAKMDAEKARAVLDQQVALKKAKSDGKIDGRTSIHVNDRHTKVGKDIGVIQSAKALVKNYMLYELSLSDKSALEEAQIALEEAIAVLKKFRETLNVV